MLLNQCGFRVYWNATRKVFSVQHKTSKGWRLYKHVEALKMYDCVPKVSEKTRQRVVRERKKYVHAWLYCRNFTECTLEIANRWHTDTRIRYNPYSNLTFMMDDGKGSCTEMGNQAVDVVASVKMSQNRGKYPVMSVKS